MKAIKVVKTKKALKRLDRVEALLSKVIAQFAGYEKGVRELLDSAKASVVIARGKAKASAKAKSSTAGKSSKKVKPATVDGNQRMAKKSKKADSRAEAKKRRKRVLKSPTSLRSNAPKVAAAAPESDTTPPLL
jgi:hypothetical protein